MGNGIQKFTKIQNSNSKYIETYEIFQTVVMQNQAKKCTSTQITFLLFQDTLNLMKAEGWKFPPVREAEAMFEADTAPNWEEGT